MRTMTLRSLYDATKDALQSAGLDPATPVMISIQDHEHQAGTLGWPQRVEFKTHEREGPFARLFVIEVAPTRNLDGVSQAPQPSTPSAALPIKEEIARVASVLKSRGVNVDRMFAEFTKDRLSHKAILRSLVGSLYDGLVYGNWF